MPKKSEAFKPNPRFKSLSFLSDFGYQDEFVGVVKSVILEIAPFAEITDITHGIAPHNIRAGGLALSRAAAYLRPGLVLAIVDPGVGSNRRCVAVEVGEGSSVLVGPDNGLLALVVAQVGGATKAVEISNSKYQLPAPGATFAGRDIFAPAAAHIMNGMPLLELGPEINPSTLVPQVIPVAQVEKSEAVVSVLWVDRFGNAQLNILPEELRSLVDANSRVQIRFNENVRSGVVAKTYLELPENDLGFVVDSYGMVSLVIPKASVAKELGLNPGDQIQLSAISELKVTGEH